MEAHALAVGHRIVRRTEMPVACLHVLRTESIQFLTRHRVTEIDSEMRVLVMAVHQAHLPARTVCMIQAPRAIPRTWSSRCRFGSYVLLRDLNRVPGSRPPRSLSRAGPTFEATDDRVGACRTFSTSLFSTWSESCSPSMRLRPRSILGVGPFETTHDVALAGYTFRSDLADRRRAEPRSRWPHVPRAPCATLSSCQPSARSSPHLAEASRSRMVPVV